MSDNTKKKKQFRLPHMYLVIAILMLFVSLLTYVVPPVRIPAETMAPSIPTASPIPIVHPSAYSAFLHPSIRALWTVRA